MGEIRNIYRTLQGRLTDIAVHWSKVSVPSYHRRESWNPAINAYGCSNGFVICVDLAGVERSMIDLSVEPRRVFIRGQRQAPEPASSEGPLVQILALEIDHGPFEREIVLPLDVATDQVRAEQRNGVLWIYLPLQTQPQTPRTIAPL